MHRHNRENKTQIHHQHQTNNSTNKTNIKTHKEGMPIRPVINKINAPAYNLAKLLKKEMHILLPLPNKYTVKTSNEIAQNIIIIPTN